MSNPNPRLRTNETKSLLQEEQSKLVRMEKILLGMLTVIDDAQKDLIIEEFQIKAKGIKIKKV